MQLLPGLQLSQITNNTMYVAVILTHSYNITLFHGINNSNAGPYFYYIDVYALGYHFITNLSPTMSECFTMSQLKYHLQ